MGKRKRREKKATLFDVLPAEAVGAIDADGYALLAAHGYAVEGAAEDEGVRLALAGEIKRRGEVLVYDVKTDAERGILLVWFTLLRGDEVIGRSHGVKLVPRARKEGENGEQRTD